MTSHERRLYAFGRFVLDPAEHTLRRDGDVVLLRPKVFDLLCCLIERRGRLVTKDELMRVVWGEMFVDEGNVNKNISMLRKALDETEGGVRYIETVPRRGYRFVAEVRDLTVSASESRLDEPPAPQPVESPQNAASPPQAAARRRAPPRLITLLAVVLFVAIATFGWTSLRSSRQITSIAVMPFAVVTPAPEIAILSEGMTESIIESLSQLSGLKVMSRNSVYRLEGNPVDARAVGKLLGVRAVLLGELRQSGDHMEVDVELIDARDGSVIWTRKYVEPSDDVIALQSGVARDIARSLRVKLSGSEEKQLARPPTQDVAAYRLYLKGRYFWNRNRRTPEDLRRSIDYFRQAIARDRDFALAYAGLAHSLTMQSVYNAVPTRESVPPARAAALKALELDPTLAEAHTALGWILFAYDRDWRGAERAYRAAIDSSPNYALAHSYLGALLSARGRAADGAAAKKIALALDPLSAPVHASLAWLYFFARDYDAALAECAETLALEEDFYRAYLYRGLASEQQRKPDEALAAFERALALSPGNAEVFSAIAHLHATTGHRAAAEALLRALQKESEARSVDPYAMAIICVGLGRRDDALSWLETALDEHSIMLVWLEIEPRLDPLREDPRYREFAERVGFGR